MKENEKQYFKGNAKGLINQHARLIKTWRMKRTDKFEEVQEVEVSLKMS